jgi:hypothetical protein
MYAPAGTATKTADAINNIIARGIKARMVELSSMAAHKSDNILTENPVGIHYRIVLRQSRSFRRSSRKSSS